MASAGVNTALWPLYALLKSAQVMIPGMWRDGKDGERLSTFPYRYEADVSGFDTSISDAMFDVMRDELSRAFPRYYRIIHNWRRSEQLPLITPPLSIGLGWGCGVREMSGGLRSGLILTSVMGSLIQRSLVTMALTRQNRRLGDGVNACIQGDDVAISASAPLDSEAWKESYALMGMKCSLDPGLSFLSRHVLSNGRDSPIAGRLVQQSASNEHEPRGGLWVKGLLVLGFQARMEGSENLPILLQDAVNRCLDPVEWLDEFRGSTLQATKANVASKGGRLVTRALLRRQGLPWIRSVLREREHSYLGRLLAGNFPTLITGAAGADEVTFDLCRRVNQLSWNERRQIASAGFTALMNSEKAGLQWLAETKDRHG
jgi:hypothetical protein